MQKIKKFWQSPRNRTILGIVIIAILVVYTFLYAPKEPDANIGLINDSATPTVGITHLVGTLNVNHSMDVQGVHITVTQVQEAAAFSDDRVREGAYTVRVYMHTLNPGKSTIGLKYPTLARLVLPGGEVVKPKLVNLSPVVLPGLQQSGYIDFPVTTQISLSSLTLHMDNEAVAFGP